jgi:Uma2 family endonuclease
LKSICSYSPDRQYVDGVLVERNVGKKPQSRVQRNLIVALAGKHPELYVWPELRMRTTGEHHCISDVCVTLSEPESNVLEEAPFIVIEILSEDDSVTDLIEKLKEYKAIGVPNIRVFDPRRARNAHVPRQ